MTIWEQNMEFLKKNNMGPSELTDKGMNNNSVDAGVFQLCENKMGGLNIKLCKDGREYFIHSNYNPDAEAEKWASGIETNADLLIIYGLGLGYHIEKLMNKISKYTKVIVIEPELDIYRLFLENRRIQDVLKGNISLMISESISNTTDKIFREFKNALIGKVSFHAYSVYKTLYNEQFDAIQSSFVDIINVLRVNVATAEYFKKQWLTNYLANVLNINKALNGKYLTNKFKSIPAIIVSAGPSLNRNINLLHKVKDKAIVFAGGSSFRILKKKGITPEFAVAIDGSPKIKDIYDGLDVDGTGLIFLNRTNHEVVQAYTNKKIMFVDNEDKLSRNFEEKMEIGFQIIPPDQTVAGVCVSIASLMGCNPIILIGQDFALTGMEVHAEGAAHMRNYREDLENNSRLLVKVKDIYGEDTYSTKPLISAKISMEMKVLQSINAGHKFINATEGGIGVANCENMKLSDASERYLNNEYNIGNLLKEIYNNEKAYINIDNEKLNDYLNKIKAESEKMKEKALELKGLCIKCKKELKKKVTRMEKYTKAAVKINTLQQEIEKNSFYNEIIVASVEQSIAIHKIVMEKKIKDSSNPIDKNLARIEFISKQMMEIAEVCVFIESFIRNVYEPLNPDASGGV